MCFGWLMCVYSAKVPRSSSDSRQPKCCMRHWKGPSHEDWESSRTGIALFHEFPLSLSLPRNKEYCQRKLNTEEEKILWGKEWDSYIICNYIELVLFFSVLIEVPFAYSGIKN